MSLVAELRSFAFNLREAERLYAQPPPDRVIAQRLEHAAAVIEAADNLRAAQRAYLEARDLPVGTGLRETRGALVGKAAAAYDAVKGAADSAGESHD